MRELGSCSGAREAQSLAVKTAEAESSAMISAGARGEAARGLCVWHRAGYKTLARARTTPARGFSRLEYTRATCKQEYLVREFSGTL